MGFDFGSRSIAGWFGRNRDYYAELGIEPPSKIEAKPQDFETQVRTAIDAGAPVLSFIYGIPPSEILDECRRKAIKTIGTATTPEEALALEQAGFEFIVASRFEGGGHRGSFLRFPAESLMGGFALIPQVVDTVKLPVIAAGGIADGRGLAAAFAPLRTLSPDAWREESGIG
jgi:nitronate monooxygenase